MPAPAGPIRILREHPHAAVLVPAGLTPYCQGTIIRSARDGYREDRCPRLARWVLLDGNRPTLCAQHAVRTLQDWGLLDTDPRPRK